jgi:hypothetical protein
MAAGNISGARIANEDNGSFRLVRSRGFDQRGSWSFLGHFVSGAGANGGRSGVVENRASELSAARAGQRAYGAFHREPSKSDRGDSGLVSCRGQGRPGGSFRVRTPVRTHDVQIHEEPEKRKAAQIERFAADNLRAGDASIVIVGDARQFLSKLKSQFPNVEVIPVNKLDLNQAGLAKP